MPPRWPMWYSTRRNAPRKISGRRSGMQDTTFWSCPGKDTGRRKEMLPPVQRRPAARKLTGRKPFTKRRNAYMKSITGN